VFANVCFGWKADVPNATDASKICIGFSAPSAPDDRYRDQDLHNREEAVIVEIWHPATPIGASKMTDVSSRRWLTSVCLSAVHKPINQTTAIEA
jgi:hypothetical protein